jgi:kinesin family protein 5
MSSIRVSVRFRPENRAERDVKGSLKCVECLADGKSCVIGVLEKDSALFSQKRDRQEYTFDHVFDESSTQASVFDAVAADLVRDTLRGYNCTIFAYGQTGSGKTHTIVGEIDSPDGRGLVPRAIDEIFDTIDNTFAELFAVKVSFIEIYMEKIIDLLNPKSKPCTVRESAARGVFVEGATEWAIDTSAEAKQLLQVGANTSARACRRPRPSNSAA